jgi:hypothetical protein
MHLSVFGFINSRILTGVLIKISAAHALRDICCAMDKLQLTGRNLGQVFNSRSGCVYAIQLHCFETKLPNLMLKPRPKQLLGYLPLDIALPGCAPNWTLSL